jgi:hypothetical protein
MYFLLLNLYSYSNLYPELSFVPHEYLCQRLAVLQESCKMAKFLK